MVRLVCLCKGPSLQCPVLVAPDYAHPFKIKAYAYGAVVFFKMTRAIIIVHASSAINRAKKRHSSCWFGVYCEAYDSSSSLPVLV